MSTLKYKPLVPHRVRWLVLHQSGAEGEVGETVVEIDREHRKRGLLQIGYHFVIKTDGTVELGRSLDIPGAHTRGYNQFSVGVCLVGKVGELPTDGQRLSILELLRQMELNYPGIELIGHSDLPYTGKPCPGFNVKQTIH